jgi:hypothetical protein
LGSSSLRLGLVDFDDLGRGDVPAGAGGLEALEFVEGAVEAALDAALVAGQGGEFVRVVAEDASFALVGLEPVEGSLQPVLGFGEAAVEQAGFHGADAAEAPGSDSHGLDEVEFGLAFGLVVVEERIEELIELLLVLVGDDVVLGGEAVLDGIAGGTSLAFGGKGAVAEGAVLPAGFDLTFRWHDDSFGG